MFQFAVYVSIIREVVRPGVMWFIRDPNDPQFNPLNDIIERPISTQLRKLCFGTVLYASIVIGFIGGTVGFIKLMEFIFNLKGIFQILPLRWEFQYVIFKIV